MKQVLFYCDVCTARVSEDLLRPFRVTIESEGDLHGPDINRQIEHACRNCRTNLDIVIDQFLERKGKIV